MDDFALMRKRRNMNFNKTPEYIFARRQLKKNQLSLFSLLNSLDSIDGPIEEHETRDLDKNTSCQLQN